MRTGFRKWSEMVKFDAMNSCQARAICQHRQGLENGFL
jgi:hypothetical protein